MGASTHHTVSCSRSMASTSLDMLAQMATPVISLGPFFGDWSGFIRLDLVKGGVEPHPTLIVVLMLAFCQFLAQASQPGAVGEGF